VGCLRRALPKSARVRATGSYARIDYGFRDSGAFGTVPNQVAFETGPRCSSLRIKALIIYNGLQAQGH
jgi:hypothetical protein